MSRNDCLSLISGHWVKDMLCLASANEVTEVDLSSLNVLLLPFPRESSSGCGNISAVTCYVEQQLADSSGLSYRAHILCLPKREHIQILGYYNFEVIANQQSHCLISKTIMNKYTIEVSCKI